MTIHTLSYHSRSRLSDLTLDPENELRTILEIARSRNAKAGVTGALLFNEGRFVQILEGERSAVEHIFASIQRDGRHGEITVLAVQTRPRRRFNDWSMAFVGRSRQARAYYWYFARQAANWERFDNDDICRLMRNLMDLDRATFLPA